MLIIKLACFFTGFNGCYCPYLLKKKAVLTKNVILLSLFCLLSFTTFSVQADENQATARQNMHCSVQSDEQTVYPHAGKSKGLAYGALAGIGIGLATSGASTFFYILTLGVGLGAAVDHVEYKDHRDNNYQHCVRDIKKTTDGTADQERSSNPVPDFARPISDKITTP